MHGHTYIKINYKVMLKYALSQYKLHFDVSALQFSYAR